MRESISNAYVFMIVITIIGLCSVIVISSLSYSKTFKIKNRIIEIIEKNGEYNNAAEEEINILLKQSGYPHAKSGDTCPKGRGESVGGFSDAESGVEAINKINSYRYCIYRHKTVKGNYYSVIMYMSFELPLLGDFMKLEFPLHGDTKIFVDI